MVKVFFAVLVSLVTFFFASTNLRADDSAIYSTPPASPAELEAIYNQSLEIRADNIIKVLTLTDPATSNRVHAILIVQYRALRTRDQAIDSQLKSEGKEINFTNREPELLSQSQQLHQKFLADLSTNLTPEQVETVKDKMTFNKVKVTYDAYCVIVPALSDADKAKILETLKAAREEAIDGGSAPEKSAIFQKYKDQINAYLDAHGHNVAQAYRDWNAAHPDLQNTNAAIAK